MKPVFLWLFLAIGPCFALAQTKINKSYPVSKGQSIYLNFDYPKIVRISTWNGNEIAIEATVKINNGETDRAFTLTESSSEGRISISNKLDMDLIPDIYYVVNNGIKVKFNSKVDQERYIAENSGEKRSIYQYKDIDIILDIKIPANISTEVFSVYGIVEVQNFNGPIKVESKYGSIDANITEKEIGKLKLTTQYGKIYTNLNLKPTEQIEKNFFTSITALPGNGPSYDFNSHFGNIYLRNSIK